MHPLKKKWQYIIREENFLSLAGNLVIALFGIAGFALMARSLEANDFGQWVIFIAAGSFIEMFRFGITNTGLVRFLSGASAENRRALIGANTYIGIFSTLLISISVFSCNLIFNESISHSGYRLFFRWYPLLALFNLPWNNALLILQADRRFGKMLLLKSINSVLFFLALLVHLFFLPMTIDQLVIVYLIVNALTSVVSLMTGWDGTKLISNATADSKRTLLHFGKYTTFTLVGTNLLRSADTFILSLSPMGNAAVALYSIPLKLTELQQIPLRSFTATAFPKMSKAILQGNNEADKNFFYTYAGAITFLFIGVSLFTFCFADLFVWMLSGKQYLTADPVTGVSAVTIVRIFSVYGLLLPIDRMTGIGLDSINQPRVNAIKVLLMLVANIAGDLIAIYVFESLVLVAVGSILFTVVGIYVGFRFLDQQIGLRFKNIFSQGWDFYKQLYNRFISKPIAAVVKTGS